MTCQNSWLSAISYNSIAYLKYRLDELYNNHRIEFYYFIKHLPEEDEKKSHIHLLLKVNGRIDTMELQEYLKEPDLKSDKPLLTVGFRKMHDNDDIRNGKMLYDIHDPKYLRMIGEERKYHYNWSDLKTSCQEELDYYIEICRYPKSTAVEIDEAFERGESVYNLVRTGKVPLTQINFARVLREEKMQEGTKRGKHKAHEKFVCKCCGQVKDLSEAFGDVQERLNEIYPIGICYKCYVLENK